MEKIKKIKKIKKIINAYDYTNLNSKLYVEFINNIILRNKNIDKYVIIKYSIELFIKNNIYLDNLLDFTIELLELNNYNILLFNEIISNCTQQYKNYNIKEFLYLLIKSKSEIVDIIYSNNKLNDLLNKEERKFICGICCFRKKIDTFFHELKTKYNISNNTNDLEISNFINNDFINNLSIKYNINNNILLCETIISYTNFKLGKTEQFIETLFKEKNIDIEVNNFCKYLNDNYENYSEKNSFIFKNFKDLFMPILTFILDTKYLKQEDKISYITNICYKIHKNDLDKDNLYLEKVKNFIRNEEKYKQIYSEVFTNIKNLDQKDTALKIYNEYKNNTNKKENIDNFTKNIENYMDLFGKTYRQCDIFITELCKVCRENQEYYLLYIVNSFTINKASKSFDKGAILGK